MDHQGIYANAANAILVDAALLASGTDTQFSGSPIWDVIEQHWEI